MSKRRSLTSRKLLDWLDDLTVRHDIEGDGPEVKGLAYDSRRVQPGFLFAAVPGFKVDGHDFIDAASTSGAAVVITERWVSGIAAAQIQVSSVRRSMALIADLFYDHPSQKLSLVGVTGTNGKTTTSYLIDSILATAGMRSGLIGGIEYRLGKQVLAAARTTPEAFDLEAMLDDMVEAGLEAVTMEVSSHGIELFRVCDLRFDVAVFTNLTRDHLDIHEGMEHYYQVKRSLFAGTLDKPGDADVAVIPGRPVAAVNIDDAYGARLAAGLGDRLVTYGMDREAAIRPSDIEYSGWETGFELITPSGRAPVRLRLPGAYNLQNALAAAAGAHALGVETGAIAAGLDSAPGAPGRFEPVNVDAPFRVVVDYAHNEDGLEKALTTARSLTEGRLITVFGCPGERDRDKRPAMGRIAGTLSDLAILTTDDCYSEPPEQILDETEPGLIASGAEFRRVGDRREAIEEALAAAGEGDTVVIAGKGHETRQIMAGGALPFSDKEVVLEIVAGRSAGPK